MDCYWQNIGDFIANQSIYNFEYFQYLLKCFYDEKCAHDEDRKKKIFFRLIGEFNIMMSRFRFFEITNQFQYRNFASFNLVYVQNNISKIIQIILKTVFEKNVFFTVPLCSNIATIQKIYFCKEIEYLHLIDQKGFVFVIQNNTWKYPIIIFDQKLETPEQERFLQRRYNETISRFHTSLLNYLRIVITSNDVVNLIKNYCDFNILELLNLKINFLQSFFHDSKPKRKLSN